MNVNRKGVKGLLKVLDDLNDKGYYCFPAFDDHSPVDLIVMDPAGATSRIQVKYRSKEARGTYRKYVVPANSVVNGVKIGIDKTLIDGWAVYLADDDKILYIPADQIPGSCITVTPDSRFDWSLNNNAAGLHDYL